MCVLLSIEMYVMYVHVYLSVYIYVYTYVCIDVYTYVHAPMQEFGVFAVEGVF